LPFSTIFVLDYGGVPTVWYFLFYFIFLLLYIQVPDVNPNPNQQLLI